jgi:hypothetical protein
LEQEVLLLLGDRMKVFLFLVACFQLFLCDMNSDCQCVFKEGTPPERKLKELEQLCGRVNEMNCADIRANGGYCYLL